MLIDATSTPKDANGRSKTSNFETMILLEKVAIIITLGKSSQDFFRDLVLMKHLPGLHAKSLMVSLVRKGSPTTSLIDFFSCLPFVFICGDGDIIIKSIVGFNDESSSCVCMIGM
jgi:hypothetical protein